MADTMLQYDTLIQTWADNSSIFPESASPVLKASELLALCIPDTGCRPAGALLAAGCVGSAAPVDVG